MIDLPPTTRIGRGGGPDRALRLAVVLCAAGLAVAFIKPWDWGAPAAPTQASEATTAPRPAVPATPAPAPWTDLGASVSCLSNRLWMAVIDEVDDGAGTVTRSWTRLDIVPATGPTDPEIARAHAYAESVPRIGFCAPLDPSVARASDVMDDVQAWRLEPGDGGASATAVPVALVVVAGGTVADGGALYGPVARPSRGTAATRSGSLTDPEVAWSVDGDAPSRPGRWSAGPRASDVEGWGPGTYVFRVRLDGSRPGVGTTGWFRIELRGPWPGPDASLAGTSGRPSPAP